MQTALLIIWPLLNLVLFGLALQSVMRRAYDMTYSRQTRLFSQVVVSVIVVLAVRQATHQQNSQFVSRQPQPQRPITQPIMRHDGLVDSPTYSLKSHLTVSPEQAPSDSTTGTVLVKMVQATLLPMPGLRWEPQQTDVQVMPDRQLVYTLRGELVWSLLTIPIVRQEKTFTGRSIL